MHYSIDCLNEIFGSFVTFSNEHLLTNHSAYFS